MSMAAGDRFPARLPLVLDHPPEIQSAFLYFEPEWWFHNLGGESTNSFSLNLPSFLLSPSGGFTPWAVKLQAEALISQRER